MPTSPTTDPGTTTTTPQPVSRGRKMDVIAVTRHGAGLTGAQWHEPMPGLRFIGLQEREYEPGVARYQYIFDQRATSRPRRFEEVYPYGAVGVDVVKPDDRILSLRMLPDGTSQIIADGYAHVPQADVNHAAEVVTFECPNRPARESDKPLPGAVYRDADHASTAGNVDGDPPTGYDWQTDTDTRFNPDGKPNATPAGSDSGTGTALYPVFLDHRVIRTPDVRRAWTLGMAARYVIRRGNRSEAYTKVGDLSGLDDLLKAYEPVNGTTPINLSDSSTYKKVDILVPDVDVSGCTWPEALRKLIEPHGFGFKWDLVTLGDGTPEWTLRVYRKDDDKRIKSLNHQKAGGTLDPAKTDVRSLSLQRDSSRIVNHFITQSRRRRYQADFVLAPGFSIVSTDVNSTNIDKWKKGEDEQDTTNSDKYRLFIFDETGEGHWSFSTSSLVQTVPSLVDVFTEDDVNTPRRHAHSRRPPIRTLITVDGKKKPLEAQLWVCKASDYAGASPAVWDPNAVVGSGPTAGPKGGIWQRVIKGGWRVCEDRLGIVLTMPDPADWSIGDPPDDKKATAPFPDGKVNVVQSMAAPDSGANAINPRIYFRLTCVIEDDRDLDAEAAKRPSSPTLFDIARYDDVKDRFALDVVTNRCHLNTTGLVVKVRDDTEAAKAHAAARRRAHEVGSFAGVTGFDCLFFGIEVGDKVDRILGRDVSFSGLSASEQGETPILPTVVGRDFEVSPDGQRTALHWSDRRAEPQHAAAVNPDRTWATAADAAAREKIFASFKGKKK